MEKYRKAYAAQKATARRRGIDFRLTFEEWLAFWGDDIDKRGRGTFDLQMQRPADTGPYALGNIVKGTRLQNCRTAGAMLRKRNSDKAAEDLKSALDRAMFEKSSLDEDEMTEDEQELASLGFASSLGRQHIFAVDKDR